MNYGKPWEAQSHNGSPDALVRPWEEFYKHIIHHRRKLEISKRFDALAQREDNWDGYESKKPSQSILTYARDLMSELFDDIISAGHSWIEPFISSDEEGYITVEWYKEVRQLHLQIGANVAEYIQVWGTNIDTEMHVDFLNRDKYLMLWEWLINE